MQETSLSWITYKSKPRIIQTRASECPNKVVKMSQLDLVWNLLWRNGRQKKSIRHGSKVCASKISWRLTSKAIALSQVRHKDSSLANSKNVSSVSDHQILHNSKCAVTNYYRASRRNRSRSRKVSILRTINMPHLLSSLKKVKLSLEARQTYTRKINPHR